MDRLDTIQSDLSAVSNKSALTYKKLSDRVFFWTAMILHLTIVTLAMVLPDIDIVFDISGAFGCSSMMLLFPSVFYIVCVHRYGSSSYVKKWSTVFFYGLSWVYLVLYVAILTAFVYV